MLIDIKYLELKRSARAAGLPGSSMKMWPWVSGERGNRLRLDRRPNSMRASECRAGPSSNDPLKVLRGEVARSWATSSVVLGIDDSMSLLWTACLPSNKPVSILL